MIQFHSSILFFLFKFYYYFYHLFILLFIQIHYMSNIVYMSNIIVALVILYFLFLYLIMMSNRFLLNFTVRRILNHICHHYHYILRFLIFINLLIIISQLSDNLLNIILLNIMGLPISMNYSILIYLYFLKTLSNQEYHPNLFHLYIYIRFFLIIDLIYILINFCFSLSLNSLH